MSKNELRIFRKDKGDEFRIEVRAELFKALVDYDNALKAINNPDEANPDYEANESVRYALEIFEKIFNTYFPSIKAGLTHQFLKSISNFVLDKDQAAGFERIADFLVFRKKSEFLEGRVLPDIGKDGPFAAEYLSPLYEVQDKYYAELIKVYSEEVQATNGTALAGPHMRISSLIKERNQALIALDPELANSKLLDYESVFFFTSNKGNFEIKANTKESKLETITVPRVFSVEVSEALESILGSTSDDDKAAVSQLCNSLDDINKNSQEAGADNYALRLASIKAATVFYTSLYKRYPKKDFVINKSALGPVDQALKFLLVKLDKISAEDKKEDMADKQIIALREKAHSVAFPAVIASPPQAKKSLKDLIVESLSDFISTKTNAHVPVGLPKDTSVRAIAATFKALNVESKKDNPDKEVLKAGALDAAISFYESIYRKYEPQGLNITLLPTLKPVEDFLDIFVNRKLGFNDVNFKTEVHVKVLHKLRPPQPVRPRPVTVPSYNAGAYIEKASDHEVTHNFDFKVNEAKGAISNQALALANNEGFIVNDEAKAKITEATSNFVLALNNDYNSRDFDNDEAQKASMDLRLKTFREKLREITGRKFSPPLAVSLVVLLGTYVDSRLGELKVPPVKAPKGLGPVLKIGGAAFLAVALAGGSYKLIPVDSKKGPDIKEPLKKDPAVKAPSVDLSMITQENLKVGVDLIAIKTKDGYILGHESGIRKTNLGFSLVRIGKRKVTISNADLRFVELEEIAEELGIDFAEKGLSLADIKKNEAAVSAYLTKQFTESD